LEGRRILFEAAQGVLLDLDFGTYPFVTSSYTFTNGVHAGSGFNAKELGDIIGVSKAYTTRVGNGAFPSEVLERPQIISENKEQSLERPQEGHVE